MAYGLRNVYDVGVALVEHGADARDDALAVIAQHRDDGLPGIVHTLSP